MRLGYGHPFYFLRKPVFPRKYLYKGALISEPAPGEYVDYKLAFGYVASITDASSNDTGSPLSISVILKLPFKYGRSIDENRRSWAWARINAYASKCEPSEFPFPLFPPENFYDRIFMGEKGDSGPITWTKLMGRSQSVALLPV